MYSLEADTELHTDASMDGFGATVMQKNENSETNPIYYLSTSYELEVLAIIYALKRFRHCCLGIPFKIVTDCAAFTQTTNKKKLAVRVVRWALLLEELTVTIGHKTG